MGMKAPVTGSGDGTPRELPPPGNYLAVCNGVYMLGTQPGYQNNPAKPQLMLSFQLHKRKGPATDSQGRVFEASAIMNFTANVKSTLIDYAGSLRGREYTEAELELIQRDGGLDCEDLIGLGCRLVIKHKKKLDGSDKEVIDSVARLDPEDDVCPKIDGDETYWDWTLGVECPKRIAYFWNRAPENPDRTDDGSYSAPVQSNPSAVAPVADDSPF